MSNRLNKSFRRKTLYPSGDQNEAWQEGIRAAIATELAEKLPSPKSPESHLVKRVPMELAEVIPMQVAK
jgi:hypothetical protein